MRTPRRHSRPLSMMRPSQVNGGARQRTSISDAQEIASTERLSFNRIFRFWLPLAATWLMMAAEGPFLAAIIARGLEPKANLAAYGVAYSIALFVESPVIMLMSASTTLVRSRESYLKLRTFTFWLNGIVSAFMLVGTIPVIFNYFAIDLISLPPEVAQLTWQAMLLLLPWPAAIGYRRFYQGILIQTDQTRRVAYGTVIRLCSMACIAIGLYFFTTMAGVLIGAAALAGGVVFEAVASRAMARRSVRSFLQRQPSGTNGQDSLDYRKILHFYYPLAITTILGMGVHPLVSFSLGRSALALESLAVMPVVLALVFVFRSMGLAFQEVVLALIGERFAHFQELRRFALALGTATGAGLILIAATPLAGVWFSTISGLSPELARFALLPTLILAPMPALSVLLSFQRALLVRARITKPVTAGMIAEVAGILIVLYVGIIHMHWVGAVAAAAALVLGRFCSNVLLLRPCFLVLNDAAKPAAGDETEHKPLAAFGSPDDV